MNKKIKTSVIIPAYNEEKAIGTVLEELIEAVDLSETEIIVVDDGSKDATANMVEPFSQVRLVRHRKNRGYGFAIRTGLQVANGEYVVWYDADGQHRPEDLIRLIDKMKEKHLDYCIGVRTKGSDVVKSRVLGKFLLRVIIRILTGEPVTDFNSGLRGFRKNILTQYISLIPKGFGASTVTTLLMQELEYVGDQVEITTRKREGKSSVKQFRDGFRTIRLIGQIIMLFQPMKFFGTAGAIMILAGIVYGVVQALEVGLGIPVLSAVLVLFGMQTVCMGIISGQISGLRKEKYVESIEG